MESTFDVENVPVAFNMDLANGPTSERFCYEACDVLRDTMPDDFAVDLADRYSEETSEIVDYYTNRLDQAGYCVFWNAGDVVVYDLRGLTDDECEQFYRATENY